MPIELLTCVTVKFCIKINIFFKKSKNKCKYFSKKTPQDVFISKTCHLNPFCLKNHLS